MHELLRVALLALAMIVTVPVDDCDWPSLGFGVIDWMQHNLVHGPGDLRGDPLRLDDETQTFLIRMYEIFPLGHEFAGRRRFQRCCLSLPKGVMKTETGALITIAEASASAPVRFDGWDTHGEPRGRGLRDPFIPVVAYTEEQSDELLYGAARSILLDSRISDEFDIGLERIVRKDGDGKIVSLASSPGARDGARTTFQAMDETHRFITGELLRAHETMLNNIPKRSVISDPWTLEVTTAFDPSETSVAKKTHAYAEAIRAGKVKNPKLFYFHRQASEDHDLDTIDGRRAAVVEARGPYKSKWSNIDGIASMWDDPEMDKDYIARVWLNQIRHSNARAFEVKLWANRIRLGYVIAPGSAVALGFDGSLTQDATALVATEIQTGFQCPLGIWERPFGEAGEGWRVPEAEVDKAVAAAFERFAVWRMYADPYWWETWVSTWTGRHGERVVRWPTIQEKKMAYAIRAFTTAMQDPSADAVVPDGPVQLLSHDGGRTFAAHIENAHKRYIGSVNENNERLYVIQKERKDSPKKIDAAVAAVLSWQCRIDALAAGDWQPAAPSVYEKRGLLKL